MENKLIIESLKQTIKELRDEPYTSERIGLAKAGLDFVDILEKQLLIHSVVVSEAELSSTYCKFCKQDPCERLNWSHPLEDDD